MSIMNFTKFKTARLMGMVWNYRKTAYDECGKQYKMYESVTYRGLFKTVWEDGLVQYCWG